MISARLFLADEIFVYILKVSKINISVITPDGVLRNPRLANQLKSVVNETNLDEDFVFCGADGRNGIFQGFEQINQAANTLILGRELVATEAACLISHKLAYAHSHSDWLVILEDDVQIGSISAFKELLGSLNDLSEFSKPTILLLFAGKNGVISRRKSLQIGNIGFRKILKLPTSTCAYIVNKKAMALAAGESNFIGTADWPTWSRSVNFYLQTSSIVSHVGQGNSIVSQSTSDFSNVWPRFQYALGTNISELAKGLIPSHVGGRYAYWSLFTKPLLFWSFSKLPVLKFFFSRINA
jgi:hypothetical protein